MEKKQKYYYFFFKKNETPFIESTNTNTSYPVSPNQSQRPTNRTMFIIFVKPMAI